MTTKVHLGYIDPSEATNGQVSVFNGTKYVPGTPANSAVDVTTYLINAGYNTYGRRLFYDQSP